MKLTVVLAAFLLFLPPAARAEPGIGFAGAFLFEHAVPDDPRVVVGNLNGFRIGVDVPVRGALGVVGSVDAGWGDTYKTGAIFVRAGMVKRIRTYDVAGGPRLAFTVGRLSPWIDAAFGWTRVDGRVIAIDANAPVEADNFTAGAGGGIDVRVTDHLAVRLVDVEYRRSDFIDKPLNRTLLSAGVVWRLAR